MEPDSIAASLDELALARGVLYRFASQLLRDPGRGAPDSLDPGGVRVALEVVSDAGGDADLRELAQRCIELGRDRERVARDHARLLGPTPRAGATPYEAEWLGAAGDLLQFHQISDVAAFYRAFGLELATSCDERADHLSVELAFLHFLCVKQAFAEEQGLADLARIALDTQRKFLDEHVARWAPAFCARLERMDPSGSCGAAARFLRTWIGDECARLDVGLGDASLAPGEPLAESSTALEDCCVACSESANCLGRGMRSESGDEHD